MNDVANNGMIEFDVDGELVNKFIARNNSGACCLSCLMKIMIFAGLNLATQTGELAEVKDKVTAYCEGMAAEQAAAEQALS